MFSDKNNDGALQPFNNNGYPVAVDYSELLQESHYYPFGMNMDGPWTETVNDPENRYLYNGKELNGDFGLNWLDYGARWSATLDIGDNNSFSYSIALNGLGAVSGTYSEEGGLQTSSGATFDLQELLFEVDKPRGVVLPNWAVEIGLNKAKDAFMPENIEEALSLSGEDAQFNESMNFLLNSIGQLVDQGILTGLYDYDGAESTATNEKGETYNRKFTHVYKGKFEDFEFGDDGIKFKGKLVISYTDQKNVNNSNKATTTPHNNNSKWKMDIPKY